MITCSTSDLHAFDYGVHVHLLEEWNDTTAFTWGAASMIYAHPVTTVVHEFETDGTTPAVAVATYRTGCEGMLMTLDVYNRFGREQLVRLADDDGYAADVARARAEGYDWS